MSANDLDLIDVRRAAEIIGCSEWLIRRLYRSKVIPSCKVGASVRLRESDVRAYVTNQLAS